MPVTYETIATTTLSSATSTITFSSIANSWTDLRLSFTGYKAVGAQLYLRFNGDTGSNYSYTDLVTDGSTISSGRGSSTQIVMHYNGFDTTSATFVPIDILSYANTSVYKTLLFGWNATRDVSEGYNKYSVGLWRSTSAITSLQFRSDDTMGVGTTVTLYGIKNA